VDRFVACRTRRSISDNVLLREGRHVCHDQVVIAYAT